jgi:hypothetical protein
MRLLKTESYRLQSFSGSNIPEYAILSHVWGPQEEEILFDDVRDEKKPIPKTKRGFLKLQNSCKQALEKDGLQYIWIDTCCIDKRSSAELSEAINSMFMWYRQAKICYAYLEDVKNIHGLSETALQIRQSRWFKRGWTLQELIAPPDVIFYDVDWSKLGTRNHRLSQRIITEVTGIAGDILSRKDLSACSVATKVGAHHIRDGSCTICQQPDELPDLLRDFSIAQRMSWAANRQTTRREDQAYCLMGLLDVNMPLLYGEGEKAFRRLQEEIFKNSDDQSILAYETPGYSWKENPGLLAEGPSAFVGSEIISSKHLDFPRRGLASPMIPNAKWISVGLFLCPCLATDPNDGVYALGILDCFYGYDFLSRPALVLSACGPQDKTFARVPASQLVRVDPSKPRGTLRVHTLLGPVECKPFFSHTREHLRAYLFVQVQ